MEEEKGIIMIIRLVKFLMDCILTLILIRGLYLFAGQRTGKNFQSEEIWNLRSVCVFLTL